MFFPPKKSSLHTLQQKQVFLSKKHIITQEQLSELCSQSKQSRSSNLLQLVTKSKHKLTTLSKRSIILTDTLPSSTKQIPSLTQQGKPQQRHNKQNQLLPQDQMNLLYQQNQKLGYRINYLNDENNFFKISINNIQKLNQNIHKQLDGHQFRNGAKNKIDTRKVAGKKDTLVGGGAGIKDSLATTKGRNAVSWSTHTPTHSITSSNTPNQLQPTLPAPSGISSSFSLISNKIHLKNLQMKVGNSIRKTEKLKKIYQGSISSLTKKAQQLEAEVNKLSRQAEYYQIQAQLLANIYKADYYMQLNQDWMELMGMELEETNRQASSKRNRQLDSLQEVTDQEDDHPNNNLNNDDSDYQYLEYLTKGSQMISKLNKKEFHHQNKRSQKTRSNKVPSIQESGTINCNDFKLEKTGDHFALNSGNKKNFVKQFNAQGSTIAIRFLSGSYNNNNNNTLRAGNSFRTGWYSALCTKGNKKLSPLMLFTNMAATTNEHHQNKSSKPTISFPASSSEQVPISAHSLEEPPKHLTEKQLLLLPQELIQTVIYSLEKEEIQQINKLESLRKEEREQKKTNFELLEDIQRLTEDKEKLKYLIEQEFATFFLNSVNTMETLNSFNNTMKKATFISTASSNPKQVTSSNPLPKSRTFHRPSSSFKPPAYLSIQQRKQQADQLYLCSLYQKQLLQSIQKQDKLLEEQYKINQEYKQKIIDRNEQENKELKVLEEQVNKCMDQVKEIRAKYKVVCQAKGKIIGSHSSVGDVTGHVNKGVDS